MKLPPEVFCETVEVQSFNTGPRKVLAYRLHDLAVTPYLQTTCENMLLWTITHLPTGSTLGSAGAVFRHADQAVGAMYDIHQLLGNPLHIPVSLLFPHFDRVTRICADRCGQLAA